MKKKTKMMTIKIYVKGKRLCLMKIELSVVRYQKVVESIQSQLFDDEIKFLEVGTLLINKEEISYVRY